MKHFLNPEARERRLSQAMQMLLPASQRERIDEPVIFIHRQEVQLPTTWRKAMHQALFTPCQVDYGDKKVRGQMIICGKCGGVGRVPMNTVPHSTGNDDRQIELLAMRKFSHMGWVIGKQVSRHRCPTCVAATKPFAAALAPIKEEQMPPNGTTPHKENDMPVEAPREMTRDDRRVIFAKLNDVYDNARTGYSREWSDKRVAEDLGVPKAWVATVRDENFGPDHNSEFIEQIAYAKAVIEDVKTLHRDLEQLRMRHQGELDALLARIKPMVVIAEKTSRTIEGIERAMVP